MQLQSRSVQQIVEEQVKKWQLTGSEKKEVVSKGISVITVSREPGSGGRIIAEALAKQLGMDLFHREILQEMSERTEVNKKIIETLDEKKLTVIDDWVNSMIQDRHLWPDEYLKHLMRVMGALGKHGRAVVVGRGANFMLPAEGRLRVRFVAPLEVRVKNVQRDFNVSADESRRRILRTESDRRAFTRKYFHANIADPANYDIIINTASIDIENAVNAIACICV